jgi:TRAP-type C4-dicarboxylate transport system permease small subunit
MRRLRAAFDASGKVLEYLAAACLAAITLLVSVQIFFRYILHSPLTWPEEVIRLLFVWLSFLGATIVFRRGGHFRLKFIFELLGRKAGRRLRVFTDVLMLAFIALLFYQGVAILKMAFISRYMSINLSVGWSYLAIAVSCLLMIPYIIIDLLDNYRGEK